jgi:hypothetical protein
MRNSHRVGLTVLSLACFAFLACDKGGAGEERLTIDLAKSTMSKAKESYTKGNYEEARETCKIVDFDALLKLKSDEGKATHAQYMGFCLGDVHDAENKVALDKAYDEFKAAVASDPSSAQWKKSSVESACAAAKPFDDTVSDRPTAKALAEAVRTKCSAEALTIKPAATAAPSPVTAVKAKRK